ncbi:MAG: cytochrome bc complex cytochrome b subunit, partial [Nitrosopumilaceae archaeon]
QGPKKVATINLSEKWLNWVIIALIAFLVFLNISAYNAALTGMKNISLFFVGLILIVFAAFFHVYRFGLNEAKNVPPPPPEPLPEEKPSALEAPKEAETPQLPEGGPSGEGKEPPKEIPQEVPTPKVDADLSLDQNKNPNIGTSDVNKP